LRVPACKKTTIKVKPTLQAKYENVKYVPPIVDNLIREWTLKHTRHEVMERLQTAGVPAFPVMDTADLFNDPHLKERTWWTWTSPAWPNGCFLPPGK
jgi:crotonobetainyl-CoA:carnitine CoA-transferase CaiB-like acyl-CoA transferase